MTSTSEPANCVDYDCRTAGERIAALAAVCLALQAEATALQAEGDLGGAFEVRLKWLKAFDDMWTEIVRFRECCIPTIEPAWWDRAILSFEPSRLREGPKG